MTMVLIAYFDESGHSADSNIVSLGGFLGSEAEWKAFDDRWRAVLERHGAREMHAAKLGRPYGPYAKWTLQQCENFVADAVTAITDGDLLGIGHSVIVPDYQRVVCGSRWFTQKFGNAYQLCYEASIQAAAKWVRRNPNCVNEHVEVVFASNAQYERAAQFQGDRYVNHGLYPEIGRVSFARASDVPALQAADLLAHETYRYARDHFYKRREPEPSVAYRRFFEEMGMAPVGYWDSDSLANLCAMIAQDEPGLLVEERVSLISYLLSLGDAASPPRSVDHT